MSVVAYADTENVVKAWLATTDVAPLVARADGGLSIFLAMPRTPVMPSVVLTRVGGGPVYRKDIAEDRARISFTCWGTSRASAGVVCRNLVAACDALARTGGWESGPTLLGAAEVINVMWLPDPDSDTPRYIVDALVTTITSAT